MRLKLRLLFQLALLWSFSGFAFGEIIDDISLKADAKGELDAVINFNIPIQYLRHFPQRKAREMVIYFNISGSVSRDRWQNYESLRSPPSDIVRAVYVSTRDLATGPKIRFQFNQPAEFSVAPGIDGQSILVHIKPEIVGKQKNGTSTGLVSPVPALPVVSAAPVAAPLPVPATSKPTAARIEAPVAASSVIASAPVQAPVTAKPASEPVPEAAKPVATPVAAPAGPAIPDIRFGGKDGLPFFPKIDPVVKETPGPQPAETLSLDEQVKKSNNQAAALMTKGRDALFKGELFPAIDAFNAVLNLPPNKYSADAQLWIGIAKERSGQPAKARSEYESYLKLYPNGTETAWVTQRLAKLHVSAPAATTAKPVRPQSTKYEFNQYGSLSMYYYRGKSWINTTKSVGGVDVPANSNKTDQSSLITLVSMTARAYNNEFDNRLVFQGNKSLNFLDDRRSRSRISSAYYDVRNRVDNYSARLGIQSAMGGGVLGRFLGISAGYGFSPNWRVNFSKGELTDAVLGQKPKFNSVSLDFGVNSPLGGSAYFINQNVEGITDRKATGGNLRYFEQGKTAMAMLDYDIQFKLVNIFTLQGTLNLDSGTDYNFMLDHRRTPSLTIMDAVYGAGSVSASEHNAVDPSNPANCIPDPFYDPVLTPTRNPCLTYFTYTYAPATISTLLQHGFTKEDLLTLAKKRTAISNVAQVGVTQRVREKWQVGGDFSLSNTSGMPESGTDNGDGTTGVEGYFPATPSSGVTWTLSGRVSGSDVIAKRDLSTVSLSYTKGPSVNSTFLVLNNRAYPADLWTLDGTLRGMWVTDIYGGKQKMYSAVAKTGYNLKANLTWEVEFGLDWLKITYSSYYPATYTRGYASTGFRWDF